MTRQRFDTPIKLIQALYLIKGRNAFDGKEVGDIPEQAIWDVAEICQILGHPIEFVLKEIE